MSENTKVEAKRVFIGAGCNRVVNNVSWGASGLVSFGAQNAVAVFCPKTAQILTTLPGHKASVNCTHWLPTSKFAFKAKNLDRHYLLELWNVKIIETEEGTTATAALALRLEPFMCHVSAVNRLAWRPTEECQSNQSLLRLTSCGDDNCVRVFDFKV